MHQRYGNDIVMCRLLKQYYNDKLINYQKIIACSYLYALQLQLNINFSFFVLIYFENPTK